MVIEERIVEFINVKDAMKMEKDSVVAWFWWGVVLLPHDLIKTMIKKPVCVGVHQGRDILQARNNKKPQAEVQCIAKDYFIRRDLLIHSLILVRRITEMRGRKLETHR